MFMHQLTDLGHRNNGLPVLRKYLRPLASKSLHNATGRSIKRADVHGAAIPFLTRVKSLTVRGVVARRPRDAARPWDWRRYTYACNFDDANANYPYSFGIFSAFWFTLPCSQVAIVEPSETLRIVPRICADMSTYSQLDNPVHGNSTHPVSWMPSRALLPIRSPHPLSQPPDKPRSMSYSRRSSPRILLY